MKRLSESESVKNDTFKTMQPGYHNTAENNAVEKTTAPTTV